MKTTFYFSAEEESGCTRKKSVTVNSMGHNNSCSDFHMEKMGGGGGANVFSSNLNTVNLNISHNHGGI